MNKTGMDQKICPRFLYSLLHNNFCNAKISPITIEEASGAAAAVKKFMRTGGQQVKGKQVEDLYDLVTVSREYKTMRECAVTEEEGQSDILLREPWEGGFV